MYEKMTSYKRVFIPKFLTFPMKSKSRNNIKAGTPILNYD